MYVCMYVCTYVRTDYVVHFWTVTIASGQECCTPGMSNMGRMRPFASTPAARTKDTVIWSFNGQNCSFYNINWMNVRRSQKNSMLFFIQNKNKNILQ